RETADAFALAARQGAEQELGLGWALGKHLDSLDCPHADSSLVLAAYRAGIPCTVHVALGTDIVHMHPHVSGAALGEASLLDFRILCTVVSGLAGGVWMNLGSAVILPEVFLKAVAVVRNFGYSLDGLVAVNVDKESRYRTLDAKVALAGVVGSDPDAARVRQALADAGIDQDAVATDAVRTTTVKERYIGRAQQKHPQQMIRVDYEDRAAIPETVERDLAG